MPRYVLGDGIDQIDPLGAALLTEQIGDLGDDLAGVERRLEERELVRLDARENEDVVDQREQRSARPGEIVDELALALGERRRGQQEDMPITPLSGVRISWLIVARNCDLARLACSA